MNILSFICLLLPFLAACHPVAPNPPPPPITIPAPLQYLAQSTAPDGNSLTPLLAPFPWTYLRYDFGGYQVAQSFRPDYDVTAYTIWSYSPFGNFASNAANNGGEVYQYRDRDGAVYIIETQDGGKPGVLQQFGNAWWAFDQYVPACSAGWRGSPDTLGRACRQTITFPASGVPGNAITADTIVSEHYSLPGHFGSMERAFYGLGWGRLAWMAFGVTCNPVDPARAPAISAFDTAPASLTKCDERLNTNIVPADGSLSGASFGWPPAP